MRVKVSSRYRISLPVDVRERLGIRSGDHLLIDVRGNSLTLMPEPPDYSRHLQGLHREMWEDTEPQEYVRREREAWNS
ncbi:MAG: AbrB/MazE/SpoVT family DNA-binding domain-containing protein [Chloroflexota bacterium]